ncbi:BioY family transporter [Pueribacillus theae]|uniref:Biotin transporter n=1 Tax=Pueribacillus theae TaxID=2171751 RepID=A0A2U1JS49_9BACI|nr:biotin transporter BioY [Pueribacillus theae]PWA08036.1 BioY family transporter [Pueribacillus theae]
MKRKKFRPIDLTFMALFAALMGVGANIAQFLVIGGLPITLQTFFSIMAGALLGSRLGSLSMALYTLIGLVGAPVFAQFTGGPAILIKPTFGFILSYILVSWIVGKIVETAKDPGFSRFLIACMVGLAINYFLGTNYMYFAYKFWADAPEGFTYGMAWLLMVPPLPKDVLLTVLTAVMAPRIYKAIHRSGSLSNQSAA